MLKYTLGQEKSLKIGKGKKSMEKREEKNTVYYSIKQVSERTHFPVSTLRYYDKMGLTPQIHHTASGVRQYSEEDICFLNLICCLKRSNMPVEEIRKFVEFCLLKEDGAEARKEILQKHRQRIQQKIEELQGSLCLIDYKLEHYKEIGVFHLC